MFIFLLYYVLPITLVGFILVLIAASKDEKKIAAKTEVLFKEIDEKYQAFINNKINLDILSMSTNNKVMNIDNVLDEAFIIIKPDIDGILSYIESVNMASIKLKHESIYFKGATSLAQSYFRKTANNTSISQQDTIRFYEAFKDAIRSDLTRRLSEMQTRNYLN